MKNLKKIALIIISLVTLLAGYISYQGLRYIKSDYLILSFFEESLIPNIKHAVSGNKKIMKEIDIPELEINIPKYSDSILQKTIKKGLELESMFGQEKPYVPVDFQYKREKYKAKMKIRGDHIRNYQYGLSESSLTIKTKKPSAEGNTKFSIVKPAQELFFYGLLYYQTFDREGFLSNNTIPIKVKINGKSQGIYFLQQGFDLNYPKVNGFKESLILKFEKDCMCTEQNHYDLHPRLVCYQEKTVLKNEKHSKSFEYVTKKYADILANNAKVEKLFDIKIWARYVALTDIFYAHHSMECHNVRMYFNPKTQKIEPIAWDPFLVRVAEYDLTRDQYLFSEFMRENYPIYKLLKKNKTFIDNYIQYLYDYSTNLDLSNFFYADDEILRNIEAELLFGKTFTSFNPYKIKDIQKSIEVNFKQGDLVDGNYYPNNQVLRLTSRSDIPIEIDEIIVNGKKVRNPFKDELILPRRIYEVKINTREKVKKLEVSSHIRTFDDQVKTNEIRVFKH